MLWSCATRFLLPVITIVDTGEYLCIFLNILFIYLAMLGLSFSMQDLSLVLAGHVGSSPLIKDQTWAAYIGSVES